MWSTAVGATLRPVNPEDMPQLLLDGTPHPS
jgi:hypothetical protein